MPHPTRRKDLVRPHQDQPSEAEDALRPPRGPVLSEQALANTTSTTGISVARHLYSDSSPGLMTAATISAIAGR